MSSARANLASGGNRQALLANFTTVLGYLASYGTRATYSLLSYSLHTTYYYILLTTYYLLFTTYYLLLTTLLLTTLYSLLTACCARLSHLVRYL